jgi:predicted ATPase
MALDRVEVTGFKSIRSLALDLQPLNVMIGANGAGKSNLISLFRLLNQMVESSLQLAVGTAGGAEALLFFGQETTDQITVGLTFGKNTYRCTWVPTVADKLIFASETISFCGAGHASPHEIRLGAGHRETLLHDQYSNKLVIADHVLRNLRSWRVYHFHDTSDSAKVKKTGALNDNLYLHGDARNLAAYLYRLRQHAPREYERIVATIRLVAPFFDDFLLRPTLDNSDSIRLEWRERGSDYPFLAHHLSDGSLRFICLCTLLLQPDLPELILLDEPELGLHPYAIAVLADLLRVAARRAQILISTQSVALVDQFDPEHLLIVERADRATTIRRVEPESLTEWLEEYTIGELWQKNVLGGRP